MTDTTAPKPAKRPRKMAREPKAEGQVAEPTVDKAAPAEPGGALGATSSLTKASNKTDLVLGLLRRPSGAAIDQLVAATGWLPHTTRAALTGLKKKGHVVVSEKTDGVRTYRIDGGAA